MLCANITYRERSKNAPFSTFSLVNPLFKIQHFFHICQTWSLLKAVNQVKINSNKTGVICKVRSFY